MKSKFIFTKFLELITWLFPRMLLIIFIYYFYQSTVAHETGMANNYMLTAIIMMMIYIVYLINDGKIINIYIRQCPKCLNCEKREE